MAAEVPMFYRVVWVDPAFDINGVVYYSTNPLANHPVRLYDLDWNLLTTVTSRVTGEYTVTGVTNGNYWFGPGSQGGYLGFSRETTISNGDLTMDLYTHRSFETISPTNNATVTTDSPSFAWERLPEAHTFRFQLNVWDPFEMIENTSDIQTNLYTTPLVLTNGVTYEWIVDAYDAFDHFVGVGAGGLFTVNTE